MFPAALEAYLSFLSQPLPAPREESLLDSHAHAETHFLVLSLFFAAVHHSVPFVFSYCCPRWYLSPSLPQRKRDELPAYVTALLHHLLAVPCAALTVYGDVCGVVDFAAPHGMYRLCERLLLPWSTAYFFADTLCYALPQLLVRGQGEYLVHHICTLWMSYALLSARETNFSRFLTHMLLCDLTGVFFTSAWMLRANDETYRRHTQTVRVLEALFALSFFLVRVVHGAAVFLTVFFHPQAREIGLVRFTLPVIAALQWLWFYKIVRGLGARLGLTAAKPSEEKQERSELMQKKED